MKKIVLMGIAALTLAACGGASESASSSSSEVSSSASSISSEVTESSSSNTGSIKVSAGATSEIETIGQTTKKLETDFTLTKIAKINGTVPLAEGLDLTVDNIKVFQMGAIPVVPGADESAKELNETIQDSFEAYGIKEDDHFLEVNYSVANSSDKDVMDPFPAKIFTSSGEEVDMTKIESEGLTDIAAGASGDYQVLYKLKDGDISSATLHFAIMDYDTAEVIETEPVELTFE